ncbi:MAG TPA: Ran-binding zinc finger domain-containing protein [Gemmatimonadaceae bacterium]|nr:Ran-binding zinc finger domain-containing protein [Gemmatimonadaceae bacterium]
MTDDPRRDDAADDSAPPAEAASPVSAVGALMEERRRFEAWLAALEARRAETPKHVFTRVHADYTSRLESVIERLVAHTDGLRAELTTLTTRIASLDEQQHRARDERAEAELRAHVGELTENAWKEMLAASDALIASLAAQHAAAEEDLRRTRELLADAERPPTPVPPAAHVPAAEPTKAEGSVPPNGKPAAQPGAGDASFDELAFLQSVVDVSNGEKPPAGARPPAAPPARPTGSAPAAPPAVQPPAAPQRREPFTARKPEPRPEDRIQKQGEATAPLIRPRPGGGSSLAANISGNNPIVLKDKASESAKTLKCAECGAMNYPTEWYCERCGAELASL